MRAGPSNGVSGWPSGDAIVEKQSDLTFQASDFKRIISSPKIMNITKCSKKKTLAESERDLFLLSKCSSWSLMGVGLEDPCSLAGFIVTPFGMDVSLMLHC